MEQFLTNPRQLWRRYVVAVVLIAIFVSISHFSFLYASSSAGQIANLVNISGKQRMLSQRIMYFASQKVANEVAEFKYDSEFREAVALFETSHDKLTMTKDDITPADLSDGLRTIYFANTANHRLDAEARAFISEARQIMNGDKATATQAFSRLSEMGTGPLLAKLDRAVHAFEDVSDQRVDLITDLANVSLALALAILLAEGLLIFWPAHISIVRTLDALEERTSELRASEAGDCQKFRVWAMQTVWKQ